MSEEGQRRPNGQFQPGVSGNRDGARRRKPPVLLTREDLHRKVLENASSEVVIPTTGEKVTKFDMWVRAMTSGNAKNRLGLKSAIELAQTSATYFANMERLREEKERGRRQAERGL